MKRILPDWKVESAIGSNRDAFSSEGAKKKKGEKKASNVKKTGRTRKESGVKRKNQASLPEWRDLDRSELGAVFKEPSLPAYSGLELRSFLSVKGIYRRQKRPLQPLKTSKRLPLTLNPARHSALAQPLSEAEKKVDFPIL